jgi:membrane dipeptidase
MKLKRTSSFTWGILLATIWSGSACQSGSQSSNQTGSPSSSSTNHDAAYVEAFHQEILVFDTHNDVLYTSVMEKGADIGQRIQHGHTDLVRLKEGGVDVQVFAVWSDASGDFAYANQQIDALMELIQKYPDAIALAKTPEDIQTIKDQQKIAAVIGVEGGHMIEENLDYLDRLYERGARYLTLTWNQSLSWASSASDETNPAFPAEKRGLNVFGRKVIQRMNALGMMVDLSHVGRQTFFDVLAETKKPVLVTHSNAAAIAPHPRNLDDDQIAAVRANGGVIGINFYSGFIDSNYVKRVHDAYCKYVGDDAELLSTDEKLTLLPPEGKQEVRPTIEQLLDHLDYFVEKAGIAHVAIGSDFDGIDSSPVGLDDVRHFPALTKALFERGYSEESIKKIMGENMMRVFRAHQGE